MKQSTLKNKLDKLFSAIVRSYGSCEWCGRSDMRLECAHINSRRFLVTRWEQINAVALCSACHRKAHDRPTFFTEWVREYLGEDIYDELKRIAKTSVKKVDFEAKLQELQERKHEKPKS